MHEAPAGSTASIPILPATGGIGTATTHAKFILIGEHSVVYAKPAIAYPLLSLPLTATVTEGAHTTRLRSALYSGDAEHAPAALHAPFAAITAALDFFGYHGLPVTVTIESFVPPERGLGSSAATAGAIVQAIAGYLGARLSPADRFALTQAAERVAHGRPSGLDAEATTAMGPIRFENGIATAIEHAGAGTYVIADTGIRGGTRPAVAAVRQQVEAGSSSTRGAIEQLAVLTDEVESALTRNDIAAIGSRMTAAHRLLQDLGVSAPALDTLVTAALQHGALGAKLTGGGQGGCIVALAADAAQAATIGHALADAGAVRTWASNTVEHD